MSSDSVEVELRVTDTGDVVIPNAVLNRLNVRTGSRVHVRLTARTLSARLKGRRVTESEIEQIAALQLEPRENVVRFLTTEAMFPADTSFVRRAREARSGR